MTLCSDDVDMILKRIKTLELSIKMLQNSGSSDLIKQKIKMTTSTLELNKRLIGVKDAVRK